jgi:hypothetical protein
LVSSTSDTPCPLILPEYPITRRKRRVVLRRGFIESNPET